MFPAASLETSPPEAAAHGILVLADDLTGALEIGALFAAAGAQAAVGIELAPEAPVTVVDLESRHLEPGAAAARVAEFAVCAPRMLFLKIDSTMRGPIAAELDALAGLYPERPVFFTPAYPALGRTVVGGRLYVNSVPLHLTVFSRDPTHPANTSAIGEMLGGRRVRIVDAASDECLDRIAETICRSDQPVIVAGSGGIARPLARILPVPRRAPAPLPRIARPLVVCGSMHAVSIEQLGYAGSWPVVECSAFTDGREALANAAQRTLQRLHSVDTLIVFGGDTARTLMKEFGVQTITPLREALPGVPVSRIEVNGRPLTLITKAGGFGGPDVLPRLAAAFEIEI